MLVNGVHLLPDISGALLWPRERLLAVADLHLGRGPAHDARVTLDRLARLLRQVQPRTVLCLGDGVAGRLSDGDAQALRRLTGSCDWVWVTGNPDAQPPESLGGRVVPEVLLGDLSFRHRPHADAPPGEIAGHLHPMAAVMTAGGRMVRPCFVMDGRRLVMPAFGTHAGGLDVLDPAFRPLFRRGFQVVMLGRDKLHAFPRGRLDGGDRPATQERSGEAGRATPSGNKFKLL